MKYLLLLPLTLLACSDYPASEGNDSEDNPIEIYINIDNQNNLSDPPDNNTQEVDVDSNSDSSSESKLDNSTGIQVYEFNSIL